MTTRPLPDRTPASAVALTEDQRATITERQDRIREVVSRVLHDDPVAAFMLQGASHSRGWAGRHRLLGLAKLAIADGGRVLLGNTAWRIVEYELGVPWEVHYWEMLVGAPLHHSLSFHPAAIPNPDYENTFHRSVAPGYQTKQQLRYGQGHWLPALVSGVPSLENVPEDEALHFLGRAGVELDAEHPATPPPHPALGLDDATLSVTAGLSANAEMFAYGGMGPYSYEKLRGDPEEYSSIGKVSGLVLVMVPEGTTPGDLPIVYRVSDAMGATAEATLEVTITALG